MVRSAIIQLRITPELKNRVKLAARAENRGVTNYIEQLILQALPNPSLTGVDARTEDRELEP